MTAAMVLWLSYAGDDMNLFIDVHELIVYPEFHRILYGCNASNEDGNKEYFSDTLEYFDATPPSLNQLIKDSVSARFNAIHDGEIVNVILCGNFFA